ncbi:MAG: hypothetical protein ACUVX9_14690 [Anaerolineae bacterium]
MPQLVNQGFDGALTVAPILSLADGQFFHDGLRRHRTGKAGRQDCIAATLAGADGNARTGIEALDGADEDAPYCLRAVSIGQVLAGSEQQA